jgi:hypothetical protein
MPSCAKLVSPRNVLSGPYRIHFTEPSEGIPPRLVVVSELQYTERRVRAFLHDPHPHRAGCAARLFPPVHDC